MAQQGSGSRLVGFRAFGLGKGALQSLYKNAEWPLGRPVQACCLCGNYYGMQFKGERPTTRHERPPADDENSCGLYETAELYIKAQAKNRELMLGVVQLWGRIRVGRVIDGDKQLKQPGYRLRAEFARVVALDKDQAEAFPIRDGDQVEWVSRRYLEPWAADAFSGVRYRLED